MNPADCREIEQIRQAISILLGYHKFIKLNLTERIMIETDSYDGLNV